jgi:TetR/AcrR family transcriptional repressor of mexJK operon
METAASNANFAAPPSKRLLARREAFMAAARDVFQEKGFAETTLDDVISLSGGSRQTLYALFGGKQGLFEALIIETCETIFHGLTPEQLAPRPPHEVLQEVGVRYLEIVTSPEAISLNRLIISEAPRIPEIAERYWKLGPGRSRDFLAEFFGRQIERGQLQMPDSRKAADHFLEMLSGTIRFQCLIGVRKPPAPAEIKLIVAAAVDQFLNGCTTKKADPTPRSIAHA